eukprot:TRINITY_DN7_c0_g2_i1.p1 TRINITY_DN7_c0_g2~~TRINITY_DN7_c0_g2_i1.p1  ORF type:complete len:650 (+),score=262.47 TRINITY_DN7_c0_g2_i1:153-1952(+)
MSEEQSNANTNPQDNANPPQEGEQKLSKNALKKLAKQKKKEEAKKKKEAERAAKEAAQGDKPQKVKLDAVDEKDPSAYYENRLKDIQEWEAKGNNAYPHKFFVDMTVEEFVAKYGGKYEDGFRDTDVVVSITGRVTSKRASGHKLVFYDLDQGNSHVQIIADAKQSDYDFVEMHTLLRRGDVVGATGYPGVSNSGELSIYPTKITLLSPCLHVLPTQQYGLKDSETRFRKRYLDLIANKSSREVFKTRASIITQIRRYLDDLDFLEVETPVLNVKAGGATAKPFITTHNELKLDMFMRIAPELFLKELVVGGLDKVYEIGRVFRNEGMDQTHNPEFTTLEFYAAYHDYNDLMEMAEEMTCQIVEKIQGSLQFDYQPHNSEETLKLDFSRPWKRIDIVPALEEICGEKFPDDLGSDEANKFLLAICAKMEVEPTPPTTNARLLDELIGEFLESQCINPTFLINHPAIMSPLAKTHRDNVNLTERFECFVSKFEIMNAYTELNMPLVQRSRFEDQVKDKEAGDEEAQDIDEGFIEALSTGLPPTGGFGLGIDRFTMLMTNNSTIREVLLFPAMKPVESSNEAGPSEGDAEASKEDDIEVTA